MMKFTEFAAKVSKDTRLSDLIARYDDDPTAMSEKEVAEIVDRADALMDEDEDFYPEDDYYEDWDNLECGFDPYMGCYSDDC